MDILIATALVVSIGLFAGILLALAAHFLQVKEDETVVRIRECLPGANCGACGYTGCDEYAKAIANGDTSPSLCIPGGNDTAKTLASILGEEVTVSEKKIARVHCNGTCDATFKKADYHGVPSCTAASMLYGGPGACRFSCLGGGDCAAVCPVDAICIRDGVARVDPRKCIACGRCVKTCPKNLITLIPETAETVVLCNNTEKGAVARKQCENACIACKKCEKSCPENAIQVENNLARINYDRCTSCGICASVCPTHCIKIVTKA